MSEWLNIDNDSPRDGSVILVYDEDHYHLAIAHFHHEGYYHRLPNDDHRLRFTHWMPLPDPPEDE